MGFGDTIADLAKKGQEGISKAVDGVEKKFEDKGENCEFLCNSFTTMDEIAKHMSMVVSMKYKKVELVGLAVRDPQILTVVKVTR